MALKHRGRCIWSSSAGDGVEGEAEAAPLVEAAAEGADAVDAKAVEGHGGFCGSGLGGASAKENDVLVAGDFVMTGGEGVGGDVARTGEGEGVGEEFQGVAEIDDEDGFSAVELGLEIGRLKAGLDELAQEAALTNDAADEEAKDAEDEQEAGDAANGIEQPGGAGDEASEEAADGEQAADPE